MGYVCFKMEILINRFMGVPKEGGGGFDGPDPIEIFFPKSI